MFWGVLMTQPDVGSNMPRGAHTVANAIKGLDCTAIVGLACAQAWMTVRWFPLMDDPSVQGEASEWLMALSCLIAMGTLVACAFLAKMIDDSVHGRTWKTIVLVWSLAGTLVVACGSMFSQAPAWILGAGVITGVGSGLLLLSWVVVCVRSGSVMNISLAFLLSSLLLSLVSEFSHFIESTPVVDVGLGVLLALTASSLLFAKKERGGRFENYSVKEINKSLYRFLVKLCIGAFLVGLANELVRFIYSGGPVLFFRGGSLYWIVVLVLAVVNLGITLQLRSRQSSGFYFICRGAIVLCVVSALLFPYVGASSSLLFSFNTSGRQCLQLLIWIIVFMLCQKHRLSPTSLFGATCSVWYFGSFVGILLHRMSIAFGLSSNGFAIEFVSVSAVLLLVLAFVFLFSERDSDFVFGRGGDSVVRTKAFRKGCDRLAREGHLTKRESEVLTLLAKGASVSHIEEKLFISSSTVATHMKHIYQKLNVHSRKELYDLVERSSEMYAIGSVDEIDSVTRVDNR